MALRQRLLEAVEAEDYAAAAEARDAMNRLELTPPQAIELAHAHRLKYGQTAEKQESLKSLAEMNPCSETMALIVKCLQDEHTVSYADDTLQAIWHRHPTKPDITDLMNEGRRQLAQAHTLSAAYHLFESMTEMDPKFAEAWNKCATVKYLQNRYEESIEMCEHTLELNPYHFGALSGMGLCHVALGNASSALGCFRRALEIHPSLLQVQRYVRNLEREVEGK